MSFQTYLNQQQSCLQSMHNLWSDSSCSCTTMEVPQHCGYDWAAFDECLFPTDGSILGIWSQTECYCRYYSPIIIDTAGEGFALTSAKAGVLFDIDADGRRETIAWTDASSANAFLVLDRNDNGTIDDGNELFGTFSPQPPTDHPNGFIALAIYDRPEQGGNNNGEIDAGDLVYGSLRLWIDRNHDGLSTPNELYSLSSKGVTSISLSYQLSKRRDGFGNIFRYRAAVNDRDSSRVGHWAYDVILRVNASNQMTSQSAAKVLERIRLQ